MDSWSADGKKIGYTTPKTGGGYLYWLCTFWVNHGIDYRVVGTILRISLKIV